MNYRPAIEDYVKRFPGEHSLPEVIEAVMTEVESRTGERPDYRHILRQAHEALDDGSLDLGVNVCGIHRIVIKPGEMAISGETG